MAVQSEIFSTEYGVRSFISTKHIATKQHMSVWLQRRSDNIWVQLSTSNYELINNSAVLTQAPNSTTYSQVEIRVADTPDELGSSQSEIAVLAGLYDEIVALYEISSDITTVAGMSGDVTTVSSNIVNINSVATNIVPNLTEILQADTNATIATTKASEASASATSAATSATTATNQATIATTKASEASASATSASSSAASATTKANEASASATSASNSATTATTKANEASASATDAYNAQLAAEAVFDNFDDKYLGAKATAPTVDNDGNPLVTGALFFKTTSPKGIYVYDAELAIWSIFSHIPTFHGTLSGRSDADSHPMSAITGLVEALADKLSKTLDASIDGIKTFLKSPIAPTPTAGDNSTKVATTAFVKSKSEADSIGIGQTWQDVAPSRTNGITYTNSTGKPIQLSINGYFSNGSYTFYINGIKQDGFTSGASYWTFKINQIIPNGSTYSLSLSGTDSYRTWFELR